jgi:hypothetical protein
MSAKTYTAKPRRGMIVAFMQNASKELADVPGRIIDIWPRFRSGDYLVTLEYDRPVKFRNQSIQHIDAFMSELYQPRESQPILVPVARAVIHARF